MTSKSQPDFTVRRGSDLMWVARLGDQEAIGVTKQIACKGLSDKLEGLRLQLLSIEGVL